MRWNLGWIGLLVIVGAFLLFVWNWSQNILQGPMLGIDQHHGVEISNKLDRSRSRE